MNISLSGQLQKQYDRVYSYRSLRFYHSGRKCKKGLVFILMSKCSLYLRPV